MRAAAATSLVHCGQTLVCGPGAGSVTATLIDGQHKLRMAARDGTRGPAAIYPRVRPGRQWDLVTPPPDLVPSASVTDYRYYLHRSMSYQDERRRSRRPRHSAR